MYLDLLENGRDLDSIEEMDLPLYLKLLSYRANKEYKKQAKALDNSGF